jgi:probable rRNA maturation factor
MLETGEPVVDVYINLEDAEEKSATELLDTLNVEAVVKSTLHAVKIEQAVTLTLVISDDNEIQALNRQYRAQDKPTDVLSFPLLDAPLVKAPADWLWQTAEAPDTGEEERRIEQPAAPVFVTPAELRTHLGDIIISWPTTVRQANAAGHSTGDELLFLLCHGVLHLVGYDDQTEAGYTEMMRLQKEILTRIGRKG